MFIHGTLLFFILAHISVDIVLKSTSVVSFGLIEACVVVVVVCAMSQLCAKRAVMARTWTALYDKLNQTQAKFGTF